MKKIVLRFLLVTVTLPIFSVRGQNMLKDTMRVEEVVVTGNSINRFQVGAKVEKISEQHLEVVQDGNLEQLLLRFTPIAVKGMAGSLSTIRLRGTSPDHTSINFGGININSMTLGHSNASNVPMYLFDEIGLQYGSSSVVNGSGSIGGAIYLGMNHAWHDGMKGELRVASGSFGEQLYGTKLFYGNGKWEGITRAYYYNKKNDFSFFNPTYDFDKAKEYGEDRQRNSRIENKGVIQEYNYRFSNEEIVSLKAWVEQDWHEIQQNMQTNVFQPDFRETLEDAHVRVWADYFNKKHGFNYSLGGGYVYDNSIHNHSTDKISTQRIVAKAEGNYSFSQRSSFKLGVNVKSIFPEVYAYGDGLDKEEWADYYFSYYHSFGNKLIATLNIRQAYVTNFDVPVTPALGLSYNAFSGSSFVLNFNGNVSKSYRVPTFNDRYWIPGGNPDLAPEEGMNYEVGSKFTFFRDGLSGVVKVNAFYLDVDNWLLWRNGGSYWEAQNVQRVKSKGVEVSSDWKINQGDYIINPGVNYSYNPVVRAEVNSENTENEAIGRQLEYVPLHRGVVYINGTYKSYKCGLDASYTFEQYVSQLDKTIPELFLFNAYVNYCYMLNSKNSFTLSGSLNNIFNKDYQSTQGYPMPRLNWRLSVSYNFK